MSLSLQNLNIRVDGVDHLKGLSAEFKRGHLYTILGRTLSGKSTLLRTIAGLQKPDSGTILLHGEDQTNIPVWKRDIAMVYQQFINYPHLDVMNNVMFPLLRKKMSPKEAEERAANALSTVGLYEFRNRRPSELSGGQQQRVALARALAKQTEILLLDEPLANLDYKLREQLRDEFQNLFETSVDTIVIYTTTEPEEAVQLGHELIVMDQGTILQHDVPLAVFNSPVSTQCAEVINDPPMNIYDGNIDNNGITFNGGIHLSKPAHMTDLPSGNYRFGARAVDITVGGAIDSIIELSEISGSQTILHLKGEIGTSIVYVDGIHDYQIGDNQTITIDAGSLYVFETDGKLTCAPENRENV